MAEVKRTYPLDSGGSVTVTVSMEGPIDERDFMILRPDAAKAMASCLSDLANAMRPPKPQESK